MIILSQESSEPRCRKMPIVGCLALRQHRASSSAIIEILCLSTRISGIPRGMLLREWLVPGCPGSKEPQYRYHQDCEHEQPNAWNAALVAAHHRVGRFGALSEMHNVAIVKDIDLQRSSLAA